MTFTIGDTLTVEILDMNSTFQGVAKPSNFPLFIDQALRGETMQVEIIECKKTYGRAKILEILTPSPFRISPICVHYRQGCGGCQAMHLLYDQQLEEKFLRLKNACRHLDHAPIAFPIRSPSPLHYRNKTQFHVDNHTYGFFQKRSRQLIPIETCHLQSPLAQAIYHTIPPLCIDHLLIKTNLAQTQALVCFVSETTPDVTSFLPQLLETFPQIQGVTWNQTSKNANTVLGKHTQVLHGQAFFQEILLGMTFEVSSTSFFQVNPQQAQTLYQTALDLADLSGKEFVIDAFCGVGTLALLFASRAKKVLGIEIIASAVEDARRNQHNNEITNASFIHARAEQVVKKLQLADLLLLNPPRKGVDPQLLQALRNPKIVYISCHPETLARDLLILKGQGYTIKNIQPVDMFPQTSHIESVAILDRPNDEQIN